MPTGPGNQPLLPGDQRAVWEGLAALLVLVAMVATLCGLAAWVGVRLVQQLL